jgi:hypothetical protein
MDQDVLNATIMAHAPDLLATAGRLWACFPFVDVTMPHVLRHKKPWPRALFTSRTERLQADTMINCTLPHVGYPLRERHS